VNDLQIYALCDRDLLREFHLSLEEFVAIARLFRVQIVQYRNKRGGIEEQREELLRLRRLWSGKLIVNDTLSLAPLCDGVHIGQEDLAELSREFGVQGKDRGIRAVRSVVGRGKMIGLSTHNLEEVRESNRLEIDYIGIGAYRPSLTKEGTTTLGERLPLLARESLHPAVAIGGVQLFDHIPHVWLKAVGRDLLIKGLTYA